MDNDRKLMFFIAVVIVLLSVFLVSFIVALMLGWYGESNVGTTTTQTTTRVTTTTTTTTTGVSTTTLQRKDGSRGLATSAVESSTTFKRESSTTSKPVTSILATTSRPVSSVWIGGWGGGGFVDPSSSSSSSSSSSTSSVSYQTSSSSSSSSSSIYSSSSSSSSLPFVYSCRLIEVPNREYKQMADIVPAVPSAQGCITINASNVTLDCQNFLMSNRSFDTAGVYSNQPQTVLKNCNISVGESSGFGVYMEGANNSRISNSFLSYQAMGAYIGQTYNTIIENSSLLNDSFGIFILQGSKNNLSRVTVARPNSSLFEINITLNLTIGSQGNAMADGLPQDSLIKDRDRDNGQFHNLMDGNSTILKMVDYAETVFDRLSDNPNMVDGRLEKDIYDTGILGEMPRNKISTAPTYGTVGILILNSTNNTLADVTVNGSLLGIIIGINSHYSRLSTVRVNGGILGLAIGNSSYNTLSGLTAYGNLLGILIVRNSSSNRISTVVELVNLLGLTFVSSSYNTVTGVIASRGLLGVTLLSTSYSNFTSIRAYNNTFLGFTMLGGTGNAIRNGNLSENGIYDFIMLPTSDAGCINQIENISGSGGRNISYYSSPVTLSNQAYSELFLCNASKSSLQNITIAGSNGLNNNGLVALYTNESNFTVINSSGNYYGLLLLYSSRNNLQNITASDGKEAGVFLESSSHNSLMDLTTNNNEGDGVYFEDSPNNTLTGLTAFNNSDDGLDLGYSWSNVFSDINSHNNSDDGIYLYRSSYNVFTGASLTNNSWDGMYFYHSHYNNISYADLYNNNYSVYCYYSSNNTFRNMKINNSPVADVDMVYNSTGNIFLNVSAINLSREFVLQNSHMLRKWYLDVYVNDSDGDPFEGANVSAWDVYGTFVLNTTTGADGFIPTAILTEYMNNGSRYYYNNYTLSAQKTVVSASAYRGNVSYFAQNKSINMSNNRLETFTLGYLTPT